MADGSACQYQHGPQASAALHAVDVRRCKQPHLAALQLRDARKEVLKHARCEATLLQDTPVCRLISPMLPLPLPTACMLRRCSGHTG